MLATRFENIKMHENQTFSFFYYKLIDIINSSFNLGKPSLDSKVVRKILRSLPKRFRPKVIAIEKSKNIDFIKVDEFIGSIQTCKMILPISCFLPEQSFTFSISFNF